MAHRLISVGETVVTGQEREIRGESKEGEEEGKGEETEEREEEETTGAAPVMKIG